MQQCCTLVTRLSLENCVNGCESGIFSHVISYVWACSPGDKVLGRAWGPIERQLHSLPFPRNIRTIRPLSSLNVTHVGKIPGSPLL